MNIVIATAGRSERLAKIQESMIYHTKPNPKVTLIMERHPLYMSYFKSIALRKAWSKNKIGFILRLRESHEVKRDYKKMIHTNAQTPLANTLLRLAVGSFPAYGWSMYHVRICEEYDYLPAGIDFIDLDIGDMDDVREASRVGDGEVFGQCLAEWFDMAVRRMKNASML